MEYQLWNQVVFDQHQIYTDVDSTPKLNYMYFGKDLFRQFLSTMLCIHKAEKGRV